MSRIFRMLFLLAVLLGGIAFHVRNDHEVVLDFFAGTRSLPFSVWLLLALTAGAVLGVLACLPSLVSSRLQIGRLHKRLQSVDVGGVQPRPPAGGPS